MKDNVELLQELIRNRAVSHDVAVMVYCSGENVAAIVVSDVTVMVRMAVVSPSSHPLKRYPLKAVAIIRRRLPYDTVPPPVTMPLSLLALMSVTVIGLPSNIATTVVSLLSVIWSGLAVLPWLHRTKW